MSKNRLAAIIIICTIAIIAAIVLISVKPWHSVHTLSVSVNPSGAGSVSPSGGEYEPGVNVTLTASPASGYTFNYWSGSASGTTTSITVIMDSDKSAIANFAIPPQPKFTTPGTGAIIGQVMRPDSKPAYLTYVHVFKGEETSGYRSDLVDVNGYYILDDLPPEHYSLYTAPTAGALFFTTPNAKVIVSEGVTTVAPTLTQLGHVTVVRPTTDSVDCANLYFIWTDVPDASYYVVTIEANRATTEYEESQKVVTTHIAWPTNLSSLNLSLLPSYRDFQMGVEAYTIDDILIARGGKAFDCLQS